MTRMVYWRVLANVLLWACRRARRVFAACVMLLPLFAEDDPAYAESQQADGRARAVNMATRWREQIWLPRLMRSSIELGVNTSWKAMRA